MLFDKLFSKNEMLDATRKKAYSLPLFLEIAVFLLIFFASELVAGLLSQFLLSPLFGIVPAPLSPVDLYSTAVIIAVVLLYCRFFESRSFTSLGFIKRRATIEYALGLLVGLIMFGAVALACSAFGGYSFSVSGNVGAILPSLLLFFGGFMMQGMAEEVLCRSYLLNSLAARQKHPVAVGVSAVAFSLLHLGNSSITPIALINIALFGIFAGIYFWRRGSIWGIAAIHTAWNFAEGNIFGINISGVAPQVSVFRATCYSSLSLINGGDFGAEGGLAVTAVLLISTVCVCFIPASSKNKEAFD
ncbi:MAG: CPBP family intramembrane metalloprotease [Ruminococcaceae bacterium]|nr:CPBP family intramembrane metalloprotease [Oscillospiraceae bacterium]